MMYICCWFLLHKC